MGVVCDVNARARSDRKVCAIRMREELLTAYRTCVRHFSVVHGRVIRGRAMGKQGSSDGYSGVEDRWGPIGSWVISDRRTFAYPWGDGSSAVRDRLVPVAGWVVRDGKIATDLSRYGY